MSQKSLKKNAFLNVIKTLTTLLYPLLTFPYASRVLLPEGIGKVNFSNSIISYFGLIASLGVGTYSIREASKIREDKLRLSQFTKEILIINFISTIVAYCLLLFSIKAIPRFDSYKSLLIISGTSILFTTIGIDWLYGALEEYKYTTIRTICVQIFTLTSLYIFVKSKDDYIIYAGISVIANVGANIFNLIHARKYITLKTKLPIELKKHLKPIFIFFGTNLAVSVFTILDTSMLGFLSDDTQVGYYSAATKLTRMIRDLFPAVFTVLFARLSITGNNDKEYFKQLTNKTVNFILAFSLPIVAGLYILAEPIILILSGKNYLPALPTMYLMIPIVLFSSMAGFLGGSILNSLGREKTYLFCVIMGAVLNATMNSIFILKWGAIGAGLSTIITEIFFSIVYTILVKDLLTIKNLLINFIQYFIATVIMCISCFFLRSFIISPILQLVFITALGIFVYFIVLLLFQNSLMLEIISWLKNIFNKNIRN